ncbi:MAG: MFS transporter, partial [Pseudomonadota bacterium]
FGIAGSFFAFAALNLLGAIIAMLVIGVKSKEPPARGGSPLDAWKGHMAVPSLRASFGLGFIILFAFVGVFTYVNFELVGPTLDLHPDYLGVVYFVFLPALFTTPLASPIAKAFGPRKVFWLSCLVSIIGLALTLVPSLAAVLAGLALIGMGLFFAQAAATAFVGRAATSNHAAANGLYLTSYYVGGLVGAFALGQIYDGLAWEGVVAVILASLVVAMLLAVKMKQAET